MSLIKDRNINEKCDDRGNVLKIIYQSILKWFGHNESVDKWSMEQNWITLGRVWGGRVFEQWMNVCIAPNYTVKEHKSVCSNCKGLSVKVIPGKICCRILIERAIILTERRIREEENKF